MADKKDIFGDDRPLSRLGRDLPPGSVISNGGRDLISEGSPSLYRTTGLSDMSSGMRVSRPVIFYGWWIVLGCLVVAVVGWSLTVFGMGVYIHVLSEQRGFSISAISSAVTLSYTVSAACLIGVGTAIERLGPKPVLSLGVVILASTVTALGFCNQLWQVFLVFAVMGAGRSCISPTSISTTLTPWFERHQGRAVSTALLGASVGGMIGTPLLLTSIEAFGIDGGMALAGVASLLVGLPVVILLLKRSPKDMGLQPDGIAPSSEFARVEGPSWTRKGAMATRQFNSQLAAFALSLMVQTGFLSQHVSIVAPVMGDHGAAAAVSVAALAAFVGRIALASFADRIDLRSATAGVLIVAAASLGCMSITTGYAGLLLTSIGYGLTYGNLTTLSPIIVRREFGAASFGAVYGVAASVIGFAFAFGPGLFGMLHDAFDSYSPVLMVAAFMNFVAAIAIIWGGRTPLPSPQ